MPQIPEINVPLWQRLASGLIVPSSVAADPRLGPGGPAVPPELVPPPEPVAVLDELPHSSDQMYARPNERDLGLTPSTLDFLAEEAAGIPFEPAMLAIAWLAAATWHIARDGEAQLELADAFFANDALLGPFTAFVRGEAGHVVFSEQQFFVAQRLLIEHARDGAIAERMDEEAFAKLKRLIVGAATIVDESHAELEQAAALGDEMLAYLVQNGAYNARPNMLNAFARAYALFVERARAEDGAGALPLDQWVAEDSPLALEEQFAAGHALLALTKVLDAETSVEARSFVGPDALRTTSFRDRWDDVRAAVVGDREWYQRAFGADASLTSVAWETTPFMQRPFLELSSGQLVLLSPRSLLSWLGDGFYYRLLDSAQRRNAVAPQASLRYTRLVGNLLEGWALDLVRSVYPGDRPPGGGRVYGEQRYGNDQYTPDVAIDLGPDLVLIEVRSGYLKREVRVSGDVSDLQDDIDRVLLSKARQLGGRIVDFFAGQAALPDVAATEVRRVWPILVTADITLTEPLYDLVEAALPAVYADARVQALRLLDPEDLELLFGMVEGGSSLTGILERWQRGPYRKLELARWVFEDPASPGERRPAYAVERWRRMGDGIRHVLQIEE